MPREEAKSWRKGDARATHYEKTLQESAAQKERQQKALKVLKREQQPWEVSRQGLIRHISNDKLNIRLETVDAYIQEIPPGSRSGKHRHIADEILFILEGRGYDMHRDTDADISDRYHWKVAEEPAKWEWEEGDLVYIPVNTVHQHFNADPERPARFISATNRMFKAAGFGEIEQIEDSPDYKPQS